MKFIIDRFENNCAIIELLSGEIKNIDKSILPSGAKEGDIIELVIKKEETNQRKKEINEKFNQLLGK